MTLAALRDALLPRLLSGEIRVPDAEKYVEAALDGDGALLVATASAAPKDGHRVPKGQGPAVRAPSVKRQVARPAVLELDTNEVMGAFRQAARGRGTVERGELLRLVAARLGYQRLGKGIGTALKGQMRAAIRRKILGANGQTVWAETATMTDYDRDELVDTLRSVMRKNVAYDREEVIQRVARHLGFTRVGDTVAAPIRSAINAAIRRGVLGGNRATVWREE